MSAPPPRRSRLEIEDLGKVIAIKFIDKKILDEQNIQTIGEQLFSLVDTDKRLWLILDFIGVEYLASTMLVKLLTLHKKVEAERGRLVLCGIDPVIYEVFEMTKLDRFFNCTKTREAALATF